jgi:hypothetical protein
MQKFMPILGFLAMSLALSLSSCREPDVEPLPGRVVLTADFTFGGEAVELGATAADHLGHNLRLEGFRCYFGSVEALTEDGRVELADVELYNTGDSAWWSWELPAGEYTGLRLGMGVPAEMNADIDPSIYAFNHPLGVAESGGMFWTWNTGYMFTRLEGKADLTGGENFDTPFAFHVGGDPFFGVLATDESFTVEQCSAVGFRLRGELLDGLSGTDDSIDLAVDAITHTGDNMPLAERYNALYLASLTVERK